MKEKPKLSKLSKALNEKNEYEIIRAEELWRNKDYRKDALEVKGNRGNYLKWIKGHGTYTSDEYNAFCDKWNLNHNPECFLDPDITVGIKKSPWANSPRAHVQICHPEYLKPKSGMLYIEVSPCSTMEILMPQIEHLLSFNLKKKRADLKARKENLKIYDLKEKGRTYNQIAQELGIKSPPDKSLPKDLVKDRYRTAKKSIDSFSPKKI